MSVYNTSYLFSERPEIKKEFLAAIKKYQTIVGSTIGGKGKQVLFHTDLDMIRTTNDGITVIRGLYPEDPIEQAALALMKQVSEKTNMKNGDFSSGSAWLFAEFLLRGIEFDKNSDGVL